MEACFLNSRSFCTTKELVPSIKFQIFSCPKRSSNYLCCKKSASASFIKCCRLDSWRPMDDDPANNKNPIAVSDWRTFRAKLVAGDFDSTPKEPENLSARSSVQTGTKWAHMIYELEKGCLLIATEKLDGVHIFERTVILLVSVGPSGPVGVILNRPSLMSIRETKSTVLDVSGMFSDERLFFGGPLEEGLFLVTPKQDCNRGCCDGLFGEVMKGLYYGTRESVGMASEMVKRGLVGRNEFRFFDGYCGWEKKQLKDEIENGYWTMAACSASVIGLDGCVKNSHGLWDEINRLIGRKHVL